MGMGGGQVYRHYHNTLMLLQYGTIRVKKKTYYSIYRHCAGAFVNRD